MAPLLPRGGGGGRWQGVWAKQAKHRYPGHQAVPDLAGKPGSSAAFEWILAACGNKARRSPARKVVHKSLESDLVEFSVPYQDVGHLDLASSSCFPFVQSSELFILIVKAKVEELIEILLGNEPFIIKGYHLFPQV